LESLGIEINNISFSFLFTLHKIIVSARSPLRLEALSLPINRKLLEPFSFTLEMLKNPNKNINKDTNEKEKVVNDKNIYGHLNKYMHNY
jgi:hypothetical protein